MLGSQHHRTFNCDLSCVDQIGSQVRPAAPELLVFHYCSACWLRTVPC